MFKISDVLKSKVRLWIEYALIAAIVVLAACVLYGYVTRLQLKTQVATLEGKVTQAENRVALVEEVNKSQDKVIETLTTVNKVTDQMLQGLALDLSTIRERDHKVNTRLALLEKSNEAVRDYLNSIPDLGVELCVLDDTCVEDGDGVRGAERGPAATVRGPAADAERVPAGPDR